MKAVEKYVEEKCVKPYIERWLVAPFETSEGDIIERKAGTPQGGLCEVAEDNIEIKGFLEDLICMLSNVISLENDKNKPF